MKRAPKYSQQNNSQEIKEIRFEEETYIERPRDERPHRKPRTEEERRAYAKRKRAYLERKKRAQKIKKIKKIFKIVVCVIAAIIIAGLLVVIIPSWRTSTFKWALKSPFGPGIANSIFGKNYEANVRDKEFDSSKIIINEGVSTPKGYTTFALFGVDARLEDLTKGTFSDSIIVLNIDEQGVIQMNSVYRDTYLLTRTSEGKTVVSKANSAYYRNGPMGAINMLNENFDLAITDYVVVNFWGLENIIDILGGIRLKVTDTEKEHLNYYMAEQAEYGNEEYIPLEESGDDVHLSGAQATAFCRLRDCAFESPLDNVTYTDDYARTARQRYALTELILQSKESGMLNLLRKANDLFEANSGEKRFIQTSFTIGNLCKILGKAYDMQIGENRAFPDLNYQYTQILDVGDSIVADTLEENVTLMHDFMYKTNGYIPSNDLLDVANLIRLDIDSQ